jgi:hypothetical protein
MAKYSIYKVEKPITRLIHDEDFLVKCEAIIAAGRMREPELFYHLVRLFQNPTYKATVSASMINIGEAIIAELDHNFQKTEYDTVFQIEIVELIEKIGGSKSIDFFRKNINHHNKIVSDRVLMALGKMGYTVVRSEGVQVGQRLENEIKNYVFIASALLNISKLNASSDLYEALEYELKEKKEKIFSHLSVLYDSQSINLIAENFENNDKDANGFALEIANMVLSDMHKPIILPLLESKDATELISKYALYYPIEKLSLKGQLADIINAEYWVTGFYTKCCALKMLSDFDDNKLDSVLISNLVHPIKMIWQLAALILYKKDTALFFKEVNKNFPKVNGLKEFSDDIELYSSGSKVLIFNKLIRIKNLSVFSNVPVEQMIDMATLSSIINMRKDDTIEFDSLQTDFFILSRGKILEETSGKMLSKNAVLCPFFNSEGVKSNYKTISEYAIIVRIKLNFITSLFMQHEHFAQNLINRLLQEDENIHINDGLGTKNVNIQV